jgi:hypothetical protein
MQTSGSHLAAALMAAFAVFAAPCGFAQTAQRDSPAALTVTQAAQPKVIASECSQILTVAQHAFSLHTHALHIEKTREETVAWWELRDADSRLVHRESYPVVMANGAFETSISISASAFATDQGGGILIHGFELPSAPESGGWVELFGYKYGRGNYGTDPSLFVRFAPPIAVEGEFLDITSTAEPPAQPLPPGVTRTVMHDVMRFRLRTPGFSFVYPVLINWIAGALQPAARCVEMTSRGLVEGCSYPVLVEARRQDRPTFVRLYPEPDEGFVPSHVVVQPQSSIEYLEVRTPVEWRQGANSISFSIGEDAWMRLRIDGVEGWIHSQEDFVAVGLPPSG